MQIGQYEIKLIHAGLFRLDGGAMFGVVPRVLWERKKPADEQNRIQMGTNLMLIKGEGRIVLVDTGLGDKYDKKFANIYAVENEENNLHKSLQKEGLTVESISDVILTHLHFDHAGGATYRDKNGEIKPTFPNARYYLEKRQYEWGMNPSEKDRASFFEENFIPLKENDQLVLIEGRKELFPGIETIPVNGHTVGQQMVLVKGEDRSVLFAADLLPTSAHVPIPWIMAYDLYPMKTIAEKKEYLQEAVKENWLVVFEHDPEISCGTITWMGKDYALNEQINPG
jgi:glyoxylase-like metal-dependent hydrolase (beta-lactamase superfamily II)